MPKFKPGDRIVVARVDIGFKNMLGMIGVVQMSNPATSSYTRVEWASGNCTTFASDKWLDLLAAKAIKRNLPDWF